GATSIPGGVTSARLVKADAEPQNWLMYWGDYRGAHYSPLSGINSTNVPQLQAVWTIPMPGDSTLESTPIVVDGVMYVTGSGNPLTVTALDARSGRQLWRWARDSGGSTRCPDLASSATTRGRETVGSVAGRRRGSPDPTILSSISCTGRSAIRHRSRIDRCEAMATICSAARCSRSTRTR